MANYTPTPLNSLSNAASAVAAINENLENIAEALETKLNRDGTLPNQMEADLDMNSNTIVNVADPVNATDGVNLRTVQALVGAGGGGSGVADHGLLSGLADDDHPQYFNQVRGDARYIRIANFNANVAAALESTTLNALGDVVITSPVVGDVPKWNGTNWVNSPDSGGGGSGSTNLSVSYDAATVTVSSDTGTDATIISATPTTAGIMSATQAGKLLGIAAGATVNSSDATLLNRANHTGTQTASTISDFQESVEDIIGSKVVAGSNVTVTYNDATGTTTIASTGGGGGSTITQLDDIPDVELSSIPTSGPVYQVLARDRTDPTIKWRNITLASADLNDMGLYTDVTGDLKPYDGKVAVYNDADSKWRAEFPNPKWIDVSTGTYSLSADNRYKMIRLTNAGGCVVTLPNDVSVSQFRVNDATWFYVDNAFGGALTFTPGSGVSVEYVNNVSSFSERYSVVKVVKRAANTYAVSVEAASRNPLVVNVRDFGATGNGTTTDTTAIQAAIDFCASSGGGTVFFPRGTYQASGLTVPSNIRILGVGEASVIRAIAGLGSSTTLLRNATQGSFVNENITLESITFDGNGVGLGGTQSRFTELVSMSFVTNLRVHDITVKNTSYIGLACGACRKASVSGSRFTGCGFNGTTANGGSALWIASASNTTPIDVVVTSSIFHDNRWHGLHFSVANGIVNGCVFKNNQEAHIFGSRLAGVSDMRNITINSNTFETVTQRDISGSAIEVGGYEITITNNTIVDCSHNGIALTDVQRGTIVGNTIGNFNKAITPQGCGIVVLTTGSSGNQARNIVISDNLIYDTQGSPTGYAAIGLSGSGAAATGLSITDNNIAGTWSSGVALFRSSGKWGNNCYSSNNAGHVDWAPVAITWQPGTGTGSASFTTLGFRPRRVTVKALVPSTTKLVSSVAESNVAGSPGTMNCQSFSADGSSAHGGERGNFFYDLYEPDGVTSAGRATLTSFDESGFTINRTVSTPATTVLQILCYP